MSQGAKTDRRLGAYRLLKQLGVGAMGTVYAARDEEDGGTVALKVIHGHLLERRGFFKRFQREAAAGERVRHPNVVHTLDADFQMVEGSPCCFLVMEYVEGRTLRDLLHEQGTVPEALVREIASQVAAGLDAIHAAGVVHRDLKPENVLITDDHEIRIMDLGVAKLLDATAALTKEGQFAGSLPYAAPEQFRHQSVGPAADLYALGVVLHELLTGQNPFRYDDASAVMHAHLEEVVPRVDAVDPDLTSFLAEVVATLLQKEPEERFPSAAVLREVLTEGENAAWWTRRQEAVRQRRAHVPRVPVRRETALHGRETELALLRETWQRAQEGGGATLLLEGEAGIGKSRLVDAFLHEIDGEEAHVLYGSYPPAGGMGGLSDALLGHFEAGDLERALAPYLAVTPTLVPGFAALVKRETPPVGSVELKGDALHAVFVHLLRGLAAEKPLLWVVEDLHFAGTTSRQILLSLARALDDHRVLLVLTTRPELPEDEVAPFGRLATFRRAGLGRLSAREVILLLQDAFKSVALADKLGARIALKSDGVPFFVFEMIQGLKEGQFITELPDGSYVESKVIDEIEVPSTVRDLIAARLRDLTDEERAILDVGAVEGFEFDPGLVASVRETNRVAVLERLASVERRTGVVRAAGHAYRFDHHQIQEVVYGDLSDGLREEYHSLLAHAFAVREGASAKNALDLPGETAIFLADHGLKGHEPIDGLPYLDRALDHLGHTNGNERALRLCDLALAVPGLLDGEARLEVLLRKNDRLELLGRRSEQAQVLDEARALVEDSDQKPYLEKIEYGMGRLLFAQGRYKEARGHFERALAIAREIRDRQGEGIATGNLGNVFRDLGRHEEAREHYAQQLAIAREIGDRKSEGRAAGNLGNVFSDLGRYEEAREHFERHLAIAREIGDRQGEGAATGNLGLVFWHLGRYEEAKAHHAQRLAIAREMGDRPGEGGATGNLGLVFAALGRYEEAKQHYEGALTIAREIGNRPGEAGATGNLGLVFWALGRYEEARGHFERALAIAREIRDRQGEGIATGNLGNVFRDLGRHEEAREHYAQQLAIAREIGDRKSEGRAAGNLGLVFQSLGRYEEAKAHIERHLAIAREIGDRYNEGYATGSLGVLFHALGRYEEAKGRLERSLVIAREMGDRPGEGGATGNLGLVFAALGRYEEAKQHHEGALTIAREIGIRRGEAYALSASGAVAEAEDDEETAMARYKEALALGRELALPEHVVLPTCKLALLADADAAEATAAYEECGDRLDHEDRTNARLLLWKITHDFSHLREAKRLLDHLVEHAPEEYRESILKNVRLNREIMEAWAEHGEKA